VRDITLLGRACADKLRDRFTILAIIHLPGQLEEQQETEFALVVAEKATARGRLRFEQGIVDVFIGSAETLLALLRTPTDRALASRLAIGLHIYGDPTVSDGIRAAAIGLESTPARVSEETLFRLKCQPFDILRRFESAKLRDQTEAGLAFSALIQVSLEASFVRNNWKRNQRTSALVALRRVSPKGYAAVRRVIEAGIDDLCVDSAPVHEMVTALVGEEGVDVELWVTEPTFLRPSETLRSFQSARESFSVLSTLRTPKAALASYRALQKA
jgi:hypothetical protein